MQLKAGTLLQGGKYEIIRTIGQGGFGITYEAIQTSLDRKVAIKEFFMKDCCERGGDASRVTVPTGSNRELVEKFRGKFIREAKMIAGFSHAHIVRILDVFEENDTAYYVMEELTGGSLKAKVDKAGPLSEPVAEKYIRELASALEYVHKHDTLHLDVKPANVLLNSEGEAVLIDFGISKHYDKSGEQTSSTPVGISKGYAPLEQGRDGDVKQFGPSTDIYALGATLYHLLSGKVPPEASIVAEDGLVRPEGVSDRMWRAVSAAMAPFRKNRPQSIAGFLSLLDGKAPQPVKEDYDTTIINKPKPTPKPAPTPAFTSAPKLRPAPKSKSIKTMLWALLGGVAAVVMIVWAIIGGRKDGGAEIVQKRSNGFINGHEYVDLGLSVKWATCNVGASKPEEYGDYFAWGETSPKSSYGWSTYKYGSSAKSLTKYNSYSSRGLVDNMSQLEKSDDAAHANWGGSWRMPTKAELEELRDKCDWTWTAIGDLCGYKVTSKKNGNSIFLPAAGYHQAGPLYDVGSNGRYWSVSINVDNPYCVCSLRIRSSYADWGYGDRCLGYSVRAVTE